MALNINNLMRMSEEEAKLTKRLGTNDKVYLYLKDHPTVAFTIKEIATELNVPTANIYSRIKNFVKKGMIIRKGSYFYIKKREE